MLTPSSIYAPGSLIPPDDAEPGAPDAPRDPYEAGYGPPPGYGAGQPYAGHPYADGPGYQGQPGSAGYRNPPEPATGPAYATGLPPYADGPGYAGGAAHGRADAYRPGQPAGQGYANPYAPPGPGPGPGADQGYPGTNGHARPGEYGRPGGGYSEPVNGGAYAYVIREEDSEFPLPERRQPPRPEAPRPEAPRPEAPRAEPPRPEPPRPEPPRPESPRQDATAGSGPSAFAYRDAGGGAAPGEPDAAAPGVPYGPDDPAYGPPSADWYAREHEHEHEEEEEVTQEPAAEDLRYARGPFEPLPYSNVAEQAALYQALTDEPRDDDSHFGSSSERALKRVKDLYTAAGAVGDENLDKHFERLLERQRQLISDYFEDLGTQAQEDRNGMHGRDEVHQRSPR